MSYTHEFKWKLKSGLTGVHGSWEHINRPQLINMLENQYGKGSIESIDGIGVDSTPPDSEQRSEQKLDGPLTTKEIQASWARAFASVSQP